MSSVVAGWYPVDNEGGECYWDGRNWIENSYQVTTVVDETETADAAEAAEPLEVVPVVEPEVEAVLDPAADELIPVAEVEAEPGVQAEPEVEAEPEQRLHLVPEPDHHHGQGPEVPRETSAPGHEIDAAWLPLHRLPGSVGRRSRLTPHHLLSASAARRDGSQVSVPAVVDVDVHQSMTQRSRGVFSVRVHIQRPHGIEVVTLDDIPEDREARGTFQESTPQDSAHRPRHARQERVTSEPTPAMAGSASPDPIEQLRRLGELREAGVVTDSEFAAKKAEVLARL